MLAHFRDLRQLALRSRAKRAPAGVSAVGGGPADRAMAAAPALLAVLVIATVLGLVVRGSAAANLHFGLPGDPDGSAAGAAWAVGVLLVMSCLAVPICSVLMDRRALSLPAQGQGHERHGDAPPSAFSWALVLCRRSEAAAGAYAREQRQLIDADDLPAGDAAPALSWQWRGHCAACAASSDPSGPSSSRRASSPPFESHGHEALRR